MFTEASSFEFDPMEFRYKYEKIVVFGTEHNILVEAE